MTMPPDLAPYQVLCHPITRPARPSLLSKKAWVSIVLVVLALSFGGLMAVGG